MGSHEISRFVEVIEEQAQLYEDLLKLSREKLPVLIKGDLALLEGFTKQERGLVFQVGKLEELRIKVHQALANHFALPINELTLSKLVELVEEPHKTKLRNIAEVFQKVMDELKSNNDLNTQLIQQSLKFIDYSVNLLTSSEEFPMYSKDEAKNPEHRPKLFDHKI